MKGQVLPDSLCDVFMFPDKGSVFFTLPRSTLSYAHSLTRVLILGRLFTSYSLSQLRSYHHHLLIPSKSLHVSQIRIYHTFYSTLVISPLPLYLLLFPFIPSFSPPLPLVMLPFSTDLYLGDIFRSVWLISPLIYPFPLPVSPTAPTSPPGCMRLSGEGTGQVYNTQE